MRKQRQTRKPVSTARVHQVPSRRGGSTIVEVDESMLIYWGSERPQQTATIRVVPREWFDQYQTAQRERERLEDEFYKFPELGVSWHPRFAPKKAQ